MCSFLVVCECFCNHLCLGVRVRVSPCVCVFQCESSYSCLCDLFCFMFFFFLLSFTRPSPSSDDAQSIIIVSQSFPYSVKFHLSFTCFCFASFDLWCIHQFHIFSKLSQEPVATAMPSSVTPKQLTLLSWPPKTPALSAFIESHILTL